MASKQGYALINLFALVLWCAVLFGAFNQASPPKISAPFFLYSAVSFALLPSLIPFRLMGTKTGLVLSGLGTIITAAILRMLILDYQHPLWTILSWSAVFLVLVSLLVLIIVIRINDSNARIQVAIPVLGSCISWATGLTLWTNEMGYDSVLATISIAFFVFILAIVYIYLVPTTIRNYHGIPNAG